MSILLSNTSFAVSQAYWTYSDLSLQAYGPDLMAASPSSSSDNTQVLLLTIYAELFRCIFTLYALYVMLYALRASSSLYLACLGPINLDIWTASDRVTLTPVFVFFLYILTVAITVSWTIALTVVTVCLCNMFFFSSFFSGLLLRTVACK